MTTDQRPTNDRPQGLFPHFGKISNGHNSATRQPIPFMFGSRDGGVFGDGGSNGAISGWIKFKIVAGGHLGKLQTAITLQRVNRSPSCLVLASRVGFSGTADPTAPFPVGSNLRWRPAAILENFKWCYFSNVLCNSLYVCMHTILCPRSLIYNDGDSKRIS